MNRCIGALTLCVVFASVALGEGEPGQGQLVTKEGKLFPLRHTEVKAEVTGAVADVRVRQTFTNPYRAPIEAIYVFPLPDRAAISDFHLEVGRYRIRGEIRRREEAREVYE
ncbi:MAG: VIT domain-containing protein, partial [Planctomycetota bacterium]